MPHPRPVPPHSGPNGDTFDPAALVRAAQSGDPEALGALYDRYATSIFRTACRFVPTAADAEDVVHDVFVGLPEALRSYEETGRFGAWLTRVTVRLALMRERGRRRRREEPLDTDQLPGREQAMARDAIHAPVSPAEHDDLFRAVHALPEPLRHVLLLRLVDDFTHDEIAITLGISAGASRVRLSRALDALRRALA